MGKSALGIENNFNFDIEKQDESKSAQLDFHFFSRHFGIIYIFFTAFKQSPQLSDKIYVFTTTSHVKKTTAFTRTR